MDFTRLRSVNHIQVIQRAAERSALSPDIFWPYMPDNYLTIVFSFNLYSFPSDVQNGCFHRIHILAAWSAFPPNYCISWLELFSHVLSLYLACALARPTAHRTSRQGDSRLRACRWSSHGRVITRVISPSRVVREWGSQRWLRPP